MPCSFLFPVGEVWQPQMNFPFFGSLGREVTGVLRDAQFFMIITTSSQLFFNKNRKTSLNKDDPKKSLPTSRLVKAMVAEQLLYLGNMDNPLRTLLLSWSSKPPSNRRSWLTRLVNHGRPPEISRDRNLPERDDADTAETTTETI